MLLLRVDGWNRVADALDGPGEQVHAPQLLDVEVLYVLRGLERHGRIHGQRAAEAITDFLDLRLVRHPHVHLLHRAWALRHNLTGYDAMYVSLAEGLEAPLLTRDRRLAAAPGNRAEIRLV